MPRDFDPVADAILSSTTVPLAILLYMGLSEDVFRTTSTIPISFEGNEYLPLGDVGGIDTVEDAPGGSGKNLRFNLDGVKTEMLAIALGENIKNKIVDMRLAILSPTTYTPQAVVRVFRGTLDQMPIRLGGTEMKIQATAEPRGSTFARPRSFRYVASDQEREFPGDTSMRFVPIQANHKDVWPAASFNAI